MKNILIACERSQIIANEFRINGFNAFSCDLLKEYGNHPEYHIQQNCIPLLNGNCEIETNSKDKYFIDKWDLIIAHPPCTYLTNAGNRHFSLKLNEPEKVVNRMVNRTKDAIFFMIFFSANCEHICVENPLGIMNRLYRKADDIIHPYYFAKNKNDKENYQLKRTCLWLKNLPKLKREKFLPIPPPIYYSHGKNNYNKPIYFTEGLKNVSSYDRQKLRSQSFTGIAKAMVKQWGDLI